MIMNLKGIIREEISNMDWISDVKSNQYIAQEIADKSEIKNERLRAPFPLPLSPSTPYVVTNTPTFASLQSLHLSPYVFNDYCKKQYGSTTKESKDIWNRYKEIIFNRYNKLNESDDMDWIKDYQENPFLTGDFVVLWIDRPITLEEGGIIVDLLEAAGVQYTTPKEIIAEDLFLNSQKGLLPYIKKYMEDGRYTPSNHNGLACSYGSKASTFEEFKWYGTEEGLYNVAYKEYKVSDILGSGSDIPYKGELDESRDDFNWIQDVIEPKVGDKFIHAGMGEYEKARTDYSHYIVNIEDDWVDFKDKAGRFYSSRHEDFLSSHAKNIIREEMEWIQDVEPNFDDINLRVGDMFRVPTLNPDGSTFSIVTIIDIGLRGNEPITYRRESGMGQLQQRNLVDRKVDFIKRIIKDKWEPFYHNRGFKLYESDDMEWIDEVSTGIEVGACFKYTSNADWQGIDTAKEMLEIEKIVVRDYIVPQKPISFEVDSIDKLDSSDDVRYDLLKKNTTVYFKNKETRRTYTMRLSELIKELEIGELVMC